AALFAVLVGALLLALVRRRITSSQAAVALLILLLVELGNDSGYTFEQNKNKHRFPERFVANADIARFLQNQPGPVRVEIDEKELPPNFGDWYGIDLLSGYTASVLSNVIAMEWWTDRSKDLLNVAYYVSKNPARADQVQVYEGETGIRIYRNAHFFPRAW